MPARIYDASGRCVTLGRQLGRGGQAAVFEVAGLIETAAKVYHALPAPEEREKLAIIPSLATHDLQSVTAWPTGTLSDSPHGAIRGVLLPKVSGREIHFVYSPAQRRQLFPKSDWAFLVHVAMNAAAAVQTVHENHCIIGDLNQGGFFVSEQGIVRLIDCDSFQITQNGRTYRCIVRVPDFTAPELQSADFKAIDATVAHDSFALGVLVFQLLFMGRHTFVGRYLGIGEMPKIVEAISERWFAFSASRSTYKMDIPLDAPDLHLVPPALANLFERAFREDPLKRPAASDWHRELYQLKSSLKRCSKEPTHIFSLHLSEGPWCHIERNGGPPFFTLSAVSFEFDNGFDIFALWRLISQIPALAGPEQFKSNISQRKSIRGQRLPEDALYRKLGPIESLPELPQLELISLPEPPASPPTPLPRDPQYGFKEESVPVLAPCVNDPLPNVPVYCPPMPLQPPELLPNSTPSVPDFEPYTVPSNPKLNLLPLPSAPDVKCFNFLLAPAEKAKYLRGFWEYRLAKWGTFAASGLGLIFSLSDSKSRQSYF